MQHKFGHDYKLLFVGDAQMSPYEIRVPGASVEHMNEEAGMTWLQRLVSVYPSAAWLNLVANRHWEHSHSAAMIYEAMNGRIYPLTLEDLDEAARTLSRKKNWTSNMRVLVTRVAQQRLDPHPCRAQPCRSLQVRQIDDEGSTSNLGPCFA